MTQIKNINAMQELTEVQEDMADTHDKFHNKSLKGKKGYITFARTKEGMFICGDGESSVIKGIQARVLVGEEVLADCYWTEKEGINLCPITFSTYTDDENDQIIGSVFIQGGLMKSPVITDSFKDIKPDAEYKIMVHVWNNDFGYPLDEYQSTQWFDTDRLPDYEWWLGSREPRPKSGGTVLLQERPCGGN